MARKAHRDTTPEEPNPRWGLIADDLTGACDAAVQFARQGFGSVVVLDLESDLSAPAELTAVTTDSRADPPEIAHDKVASACRWMRERGIRVLYKKIDSTLRGNVGAELEAVVDTCGFRSAVVTPAFPAMGRAVIDGRLHIHGKEPRTPVDLSSLLPPNKPFYEMDALTDQDLSAIAAQALAEDPMPLLAGSAGLAQAAAVLLAERYARKPSTARPERHGLPALFVIGSVHSTTQGEIDYLHRTRPCREAPLIDIDKRCMENVLRQKCHLLVHPPWDRNAGDHLERLQEVVTPAYLSGLALSGGETAHLVCEALAVKAIDLKGEVAAGIPWGCVVGGPANGLTIVTKAGGFGKAESLALIADTLSSWETSRD